MAIDRPARQHARWLALVDVSGPFLSMPVLLKIFPHGLDRKENEAEVRHRAHQGYDEWVKSQGGRADGAAHREWLRFVLTEVLEIQGDAILEGEQLPGEFVATVKEYGEVLRPDAVIQSPYEPQPRLLIQYYPATQDLNRVTADRAWKASPATRMMELLRNCGAGVRLGLVTNGRAWMLVDAPVNETTGFYSWDASLWSEEPLTLQAFRSLLGMERFFGVPEKERLEALLSESALKQQDVTTRLGEQVRRAVETLVKTLDRLDKDSQRSLLRDVSDKELYEAALTVMMRLVFLLSAEERDLLLLGEPLYDENYAVSTMVKQLQEQANQQTEEVLGLRYDAWSRLLAIFRIVYGGVEHPDLSLPAYGGHLFNPDRYPFLEGRDPGTSWLETAAEPLSIDNRTVLHLLNALQYLQVPIPGGGVEARRLSFRGLDVEQIGHVYEGLLDHTAFRAKTTMLGLMGAGNNEPEVALEAIEKQASRGQKELLDYLHEKTERSINALQKGLAQTLEKQQERSRLMAACDNRQDIFDRVHPYAGLLRKDSLDNFVLVTPGSIFVTAGTDRRSTGTHYTPRSLTEPIVQHALDPLVYTGPAEGWSEEQWRLRSVAEILDMKICDMAMGSGAFLVQTCRYLSEKLVMAWEHAEEGIRNAGEMIYLSDEGQLTLENDQHEPLPAETEERLAIARRLVAERCIYGVDRNPMAVEMAKLSLWLITLAKNKPFTFLDHALRYGDSLLGVNERQLANWSMDAREGVIKDTPWVHGAMIRTLPAAIRLRKEISTIHERHVRDVEAKERKLREAEEAMELARLGADLLIGITLSDAKRRPALEDTLGSRYFILAEGYEEGRRARFTGHGWENIREEFVQVRAEVDELLRGRRPFHWPLEFPEVFVGKGDRAGFAAIVSNPPFMGGSKITGELGTDYREYLVEYLARRKKGLADLCAYFSLRMTSLVMHNGMSGLLATNTIAQGDTREVGLDQIVDAGWIIPRAVSSRKWPGEASLEVAHIWLRNGEWHNTPILDGKMVESITPFLTPSGKIQGTPHTLVINSGKSFIGSYPLGMGFTLEVNEAYALIAKDQRNKNVLFPYLNGEDLYSRFDQSPRRWIINFHNWSLEKAETYLDCIQIVREKVKPERMSNSDKKLCNNWWLYKRTSPALYSAIAGMKQVLVRTQVSKTWGWVFVPANIIYDQKLIVFAFDSNTEFSLLQSSFHWEWALQYGATLRQDLTYTPTTCFETFPFPSDTSSLEDIGERYYTHRQSIMFTRQEGLTKTYNRFHDPDETSPDIVKLRELHKEMDEAVARAYGWEDLRLEHGFHETKQGVRYTISEVARREVLDRLLLLNHERHEEEVKAGVLEKGAKGKAKKEKKGESGAKGNKKGGGESSSDGEDRVGKGEGEAVEQGTLFS